MEKASSDGSSSVSNKEISSNELCRMRIELSVFCEIQWIRSYLQGEWMGLIECRLFR